MGALTGSTISSSYSMLLKTESAGIGTLKAVQDGLGSDTSLKLSDTSHGVVSVDGSLGVGLDAPDYVLHTKTAANYVGKFESTTAGASIILGDNGSTTDGNRITATSDVLNVTTANVSAFTIDDSQNIGLGVVPDVKLDVRATDDANLDMYLINPSQTTDGRTTVITFGKDTEDNDSGQLQYVAKTTVAERSIELNHFGKTGQFALLNGGAITCGGLKLDGGVIGHGSDDDSSITICGGTSSGTTGANITLGGSSGDDDRKVTFKANSTETMSINSTGNVTTTGTATSSGDSRSTIAANDNTAMAAGVGGGISFGGQYKADGSIISFAGVWGEKLNGTTNDDSGQLHLGTKTNGGNVSSHLVIGPEGQIGLGGASYGTSGQVIISGGDGAAPSWSDLSNPAHTYSTDTPSGGSDGDIWFQYYS